MPGPFDPIVLQPPDFAAGLRPTFQTGAAPMPAPQPQTPGPMPPQASMPAFQPPTMTPPQAQRPGVRELLPLIIGAVAGRGNPSAIAAGATGWLKGQELRRQERETAEENQRRKALESAEFYRDLLTAAQGYDDETVLRRDLEAMRPLAELYGINVDTVHVSDVKQADRAKKDAETQFAQLEKVHGAVVHDPAWQQAHQVSGTPVSVLARMAGRPAVTNPQGQVVGPTAKEQPQNPRSLQAKDVTVNGRRVTANYNPDDGKFYDQQGKVIPDAVLYDAPAGTGSEPLVAVVGPDGRNVLVPRSQAEGKQPAAGSGVGSRRVMSSDANRVAELDTSLDDIAVLERDLGQTGAASQLGASIPNWATELTGWGVDAKQRQAVIDRVKQVIGKALEGGVLRKEDEYKYTKILPTIGDPPEVAQQKIRGLREAIVLRRQRLLESLEDAGFDTSGYSEGAPAAAGGEQVTVQTPDGKAFSFPTQAAADAFKRKAGLP